MNENAAQHNLVPAGYVILRGAQEAGLSDDYRRAFGCYSGVDRLPMLLPTDAVIREVLGEPPVQDASLAATIEQWLDSRFGNTAFISSRDQALRLLKSFRACGFNFELAYCELAWAKGEEDRLTAYATIDDGPPVDSEMCGFDVSWPTCNHSAILQPGIVPSSPVWRARLNQYGLLKEYEDAVTLRDEYLVLYPYPPFDIYIVHNLGLE